MLKLWYHLPYVNLLKLVKETLHYKTFLGPGYSHLIFYMCTDNLETVI